MPPTYDYECSECDHCFEVFQNMSDPKITQCPECSEETLQRLVGCGTSVVFKGDGDSRSTSIKEKENKKIFRAAQLARRMKHHGVVKMDEHIMVKDVSEKKHDRLPPIAPPSVKVPERK